MCGGSSLAVGHLIDLESWKSSFISCEVPNIRASPVAIQCSG